MESRSTTIRNLFIVIGGLAALWFAYRRSIVADRQANTSYRGLLNERYQKGAEMLGNHVLSVRLGGIYALQRLAEDHPTQYHVRIMQLLSAFVRNPTKDDDYQEPSDTRIAQPILERIREDVQAAMTAIGSRSDSDVALEQEEKFNLNLGGANLTYLHLPGGNLTGANLENVIFYPKGFAKPSDPKLSPLEKNFIDRAILSEVDFSGATLSHANLTRASLYGAILRETRLFETNLCDVELTGAIGLTQEQLTRAIAAPPIAPDLGHTGLKWPGKRLVE